MKRLAVEVAKKDSNIALFYRYDQQLFKHLAFEVFSDDRHGYSPEDLVEFLDEWKDSVHEEEERFSADRETKLHDLYHSRHEIEKQVFFWIIKTSSFERRGKENLIGKNARSVR